MAGPLRVVVGVATGAVVFATGFVLGNRLQSDDRREGAFAPGATDSTAFLAPSKPRAGNSLEAGEAASDSGAAAPSRILPTSQDLTAQEQVRLLQARLARAE